MDKAALAKFRAAAEEAIRQIQQAPTLPLAEQIEWITAQPQMRLPVMIWASRSSLCIQCLSCRYHHGQIYGAALLCCALHPSGPESEVCADYAIEPEADHPC